MLHCRVPVDPITYGSTPKQNSHFLSLAVDISMISLDETPYKDSSSSFILHLQTASSINSTNSSPHRLGDQSDELVSSRLPASLDAIKSRSQITNKGSSPRHRSISVLVQIWFVDLQHLLQTFDILYRSGSSIDLRLRSNPIQSPAL